MRWRCRQVWRPVANGKERRNPSAIISAVPFENREDHELRLEYLR
jgi:hypothetical protein